MLLGFLLCLLPSSNVSAQISTSRHKPGPTFMRGVVARLDSLDPAGPHAGFLMTTHSHGSFQVDVTANTAVTEKGIRGRAALHLGDHVGVRGFVAGQEIRAIYVHIYPRRSKPKAYSLRGIVSSVQGATVLIDVNGAEITVEITSRTAVRAGSGLASASSIRAGEKVLVRVQRNGKALLAIRVHVYHHRASGRHVKIKGTIAAVSPGSLTVRAGTGIVTIATTPATHLYRGNKRSGSTALASGQSVTVFACCLGRPLVASSIHVRKSVSTHAPKTLLRGWIIALAPGSIRITQSSGQIQVHVTGVTRYSVGAAPQRFQSLQIGDEVSIRAVTTGGTPNSTAQSWSAISVHVFATSRHPRSVTGVVLSVSRSGIVVLDRGKRYAVSVSRQAQIELSGHPSTLPALRIGDHVRITGRLVGPSTLLASRITARRLPPKLTTVRGTVTSVGSGFVTISDAAGQKTRVELTPATAILLHAQPAPRDALFTGVHASARGIMRRGALAASTVTLTVRSRTLLGRVSHNGRKYLLVARGTVGSVRVDLPPGVSVMNGKRSVQVGVGAYVRVVGYEVVAGSIHAVSVRVQHPPVSLSGTALHTSTGLSLDTSQGHHYRLHFTARTQIATGRETINLTKDTIPAGAHISVQGTIATDGRVDVSTITVRLASVTLRGAITALDAGSLTIAVLPSPVTVQIGPQTTFEQGTHVLALTDLVVGDSVTVYGYRGTQSTILARKVLVHRRIVGLDGTVSSLTADGFMLDTVAGPHRVILSPATIYTKLVAGSIVIGMAVHVTGYLRGDEAVLATRVRAGKHHTKPSGITGELR